MYLTSAIGQRQIVLGTRMGAKLVKLTLCLIAVPSWAADLPDPRITPGSINPDVAQENIHSTVCVNGWTRRVRPPANYTNRLKKKQIREYGYADRNPKDHEEDQLIPLNVGGNPTDPRNLWPEPHNSERGADCKNEL